MKFLDLLARIISKVSKRTKIYGIKRQELARENISLILGKANNSDLDKIFEFHAFYHLVLATYPLIGKYVKVAPEPSEVYQETMEVAWEKGVIFVSAHVGVPEISSKIFTQNGIKVYALVEQLDSKIQKIFFNTTRKFIGVNVTTSLKKLISEMRNSKGKIFAFLVDRPVPNSKPVQMFGQIFYISDLPFRLSERFGLPVYGFACVRKNNVFKLEIEKIPDFTEMIKFIERIIKQNYTQWNPFFLKVAPTGKKMD